MTSLTPAQLDAAAEKWNAHVERLLRKRKSEIKAHTKAFAVQSVENEDQRQQRRMERYLRVQAARRIK
jgi:hypothetical protein